MNRQNKLSEMRQKIKQSLFPQKQPIISNQCTKENEGKRSMSNQQLQVKPQIKEKKEKATIQYSFHDYYETGEIIGQGSNGLVKICYKKSNSSQLLNFGHIPTKYAVKIIPNADDPELINTIIRTFNINRSLNCIPSVIQAMDLFIDEQEEVSYWVMEFCEWNNLEHYMNRNMTEKQIKEIMRQLAMTLQSIHNKGICHRDIKPDNILIKLGEQVEIKIIDFGVSKKYFKKNKDGKIIHEMWTRTGTILYQAPEIFLCGIYNEKIDIWSCGIILFQLLCHQFPFISETIIDTIEKITSTQQNPWRMAEFMQLSKIEQDLLKRLLKKVPEKRLTAEEFLLHPLFSTHSIKQDSFRDDTQLTVKKEKKQRDFKIATALQLSDLFNPCKINSPMYLNPIQNYSAIAKDTQQINNHIYYHQKNGINHQYKTSDLRMRSKQNFSGKSSFLFMSNSRENSPPITTKLFDQLDETNEDEEQWTRTGFRYLDQQIKRKFSK